MRAVTVILLVLALLAAAAAAWDEADHEIFRLAEELEKTEGKGTTFYSFLGADQGPAATIDELTKAYRKRSRQLHPDKSKGTSSMKEATERFARLGVIAKILRGPQRERYDFFLKKGFPRWKGTGYYYARFRPGLGSVLVFLYLITSAAHYLIRRVTVQSQRRHMEQYIADCKAQAWPNGFPPADASKRRVQFGNGKAFVVYADGTTCLVGDGGDEFPLDPADVPDARWADTVLYSLPRWAYAKTVGPYVGPYVEPYFARAAEATAGKAGKADGAGGADSADKKAAKEPKPVAAAAVAGRRRRRK
ncbi:uncharacterized protein V1510DRAFT_420445 [Dipodascopsis tothii]|uniref:uncharacterized protein n=1 Tax=Dipodascopsis tothii TaxID=44089 RepID=UPI0034CD3337